MASRKLHISLIFISLWAFSCAQNGGDTLVLVDNLAIRETHSTFFKDLQGKKMPGGLFYGQTYLSYIY